MMTFSTTTELLQHQADAVAKLLPSRVGALFAEMGTGKSRMLIELAKIRAAKGKIARVVWFCPTSIRTTIVTEILRHTDCDEDDIYVFDERTRSDTIALDRFWYVVGIEGMGSSTRIVAAFDKLLSEDTFVAVDESTYIKGFAAKRTQRITHMSRRALYRIVLTGTPLTQGAVDLYSQMTFLSPKILGYNSFYSFAANHLEYYVDRTGRRTGRIDRTHNTPYLAAKMAPYVYQITKDECLTLPAKLYESHYVSATISQQLAYEQAKEEILNPIMAEAELDFDENGEIIERPIKRGSDISDLAILRLFTTLQSIACGYWKGERLDSNRVIGVVQVCERLPANEKVVIWAKYRLAVEDIVHALGAVYGADSVQQFHGGLTAAGKEAELAKWRESGRFLVATQASGGHGLMLVEASTAIFFANSFKYAERIQAEDRIHRIGQDRPCTYVNICTRLSIDKRIEEALSGKKNTLASFRRQVDIYRKKGLKDRIREAIRAL